MQNQVGPAKAKEVFAAGNTGIGFHSFFHYIAGPEIERVYVIKGGPGTGKSTLMRQIAAAAMADGLGVELHHCASDIDSLDGLVIPDRRVAFIDGMQPHIYDPPYPGVIGQMLNLGKYWRSAGIRTHRQEIVAASQEGQRLFGSAYRYLRAAKEIQENRADKIRRLQDWGWVNRESARLQRKLFVAEVATCHLGRERHLFASAITPAGPCSYLESLTGTGTEVTVIKGSPGSGRSTLLQKIASTAKELGYGVESYHDPIDPNKLQHLLVPALDVLFATCGEPFPFPPALVGEVIDLDEGLNHGKMTNQQVELETDRQTFLGLLDTGVEMLRRARATHQEVETYYGDNMDFAALDGLRDRLLADVLGKAAT